MLKARVTIPYVYMKLAQGRYFNERDEEIEAGQQDSGLRRAGKSKTLGSAIFLHCC
jgi:hypothetical protein